MATKKGTQSRRRHSSDRPSFAAVKGKIVEDVEIGTTEDSCVIGIMFQDRTYLSFDVEIGGLTISPDLAGWKTGNYKPLKRWRPVTN